MWEVCHGDNLQSCMTRRGVTRCHPDLGSICFVSWAGLGNCDQAWELLRSYLGAFVTPRECLKKMEFLLSNDFKVSFCLHILIMHNNWLHYGIWFYSTCSPLYSCSSLLLSSMSFYFWCLISFRKVIGTWVRVIYRSMVTYRWPSHWKKCLFLSLQPLSIDI